MAGLGRATAARKPARQSLTRRRCATAALLLGGCGLAGAASASLAATEAERIREALPWLNQYLPAALLDRCAAQLAAPAPVALRERAQRLLRNQGVSGAGAWPLPVLMGLCANGLPTTPAFTALVFAIIEKESSFVAHALLPDQPEGFRKIGYRLIDDTFSGEPTAAARIFGDQAGARLVGRVLALGAELGIASGGRARATFDGLYERFDWDAIATEWDVEHVLTEDVLRLSRERTPLGLAVHAALATVPELEARLRTHALLSSIGPMQVPAGPALSQARATQPDITEAELRSLLYTIEAGVYFGVAHLERFTAIYATDTPPNERSVAWIAADYSGGLYASRNAALLEQIGTLTAREFPDDTRLRSGLVEQALLEVVSLTPGGAAGLPRELTASGPSESIAAALRHERAAALEQTAIYRLVRERYAAVTGRPPHYAALPRLNSRSPKVGPFAVSAVATRTARSFADACQVLGCAPADAPAD